MERLTYKNPDPVSKSYFLVGTCTTSGIINKLGGYEDRATPMTGRVGWWNRIKGKTFYFNCPACGRGIEKKRYCEWCGQRIQ